MTNWDDMERELRRICPGLELRREEPMSKHTSFRVGGPVRLMALPRKKGEIQGILKTAKSMGIVPFFLGNGTNLLVADAGYEGFVVKLAGDFNQVQEAGGNLTAGAAVLLSRLANAALERGLTGLEFAQGIPGSVGGGVSMNAGAYGGELAQVLDSVTALELDGTKRVIPARECGLGYRRSIFSDGTRLILSASFALTPGDRAAISSRMAELAAQRKAKQPLEYPSAGSTFKRPSGYFAAALIDQCGLKGLTVGGAQVSEKHAGFVINRGGATCSDILKVVEQVKKRVLDATGVELELEVKTLGG